MAGPGGRAFGRLALAVLAFGGALLVAEGSVHVLAPQPLGAGDPPPLLRGMLTVPGEHRVATSEYDVQVHVNARGFVDHEWGPKHGPRVVVVGDSFVQAAQVGLDEGFGRVLERALGGDVEVLSVGIPGAGTATAYDALDAYVLPLEPDLVILGFLVANDVLNNDPLLDSHTDKPFYRIGGSGLVRTDPVLASAPLPWMWERSELFRLVARTWAARREAEARLAAGSDGVPVELEVYGSKLGARWELAWTTTDALIRAMSLRCAEAHVSFGILLFPDAVQATRAGRARVNRRWPVVASWDPSLAQARALAIASARAPALDLLPALSAADTAGKSVYFADDGHWTVEGHRSAAEAAAPFVADLLTRAVPSDGH